MSISHSSPSSVVCCLIVIAASYFATIAQTPKPKEPELFRPDQPLKRQFVLDKDASVDETFQDLGTVCGSHPGSSIVVAANAATFGYSTLKAAFDAINAGTRTGSIEISVCGNTVETASAVLFSSGTGSSNYSDVTIRPVGGPHTIEGTITGAIIRLNGADNVTIDGRLDGNDASRSLTVRNNSTANGTAAVWLSSVAAGNGATNNMIRNLEIACGTDATSASTNLSVGIIMSGTTINLNSDGPDNDNNTFAYNRIIKARYGIVTRGVSANLNVAPQITNNIVGPENFGSDQIGKVGIYLQFDTGAVVSDNTVQNVGCLEPQACAGGDRVGIAIGHENWGSNPAWANAGNSYSVLRNKVVNIVEENFISAVGINIATQNNGAPTNNLVANNMIMNVRSNGQGAEQTAGIGVAAGHSDSIVFNSVALFGDVDPGATLAPNSHGSAIRIASAATNVSSNLSLKNNSVYLDLYSSSAPALRFYAISVPTDTYSFGTGGLDHNNYFVNPTNSQLLTGGIGTNTGATLTSSFATLANWRAAFATPQDANSIQADPLYIDIAGNQHIAAGSPNVNAGTAIGAVLADIDGQARGKTPDIGADEFAAPTAAGVSAGGRVTTASGLGISNASVRIEGGGLTEPRLARTNGFGYYTLDGLTAGQTYVITVTAKRHAFAEPTRLITLFDSVQDADFVAEP